MKKIFVVVAAALMTTVFVGCGDKTAGVSDKIDSTAVDSVVDSIVVDSVAEADSVIVDSAVVAE